MKPLRIADGVGMITAFIGFIMAVTIVIKKIMYTDFQAGWSSLMSVILILSGMLFLILGIIGEYIGRIYMVLNKTPQSVVRSVYFKPSSEDDTGK